MSGFIDLILNFFMGIANELNTHTVEGISILAILVGSIAIGIIFNVFWKGEKG